MQVSKSNKWEIPHPRIDEAVANISQDVIDEVESEVIGYWFRLD